jgi:hypothetical protein
LHTPKRGDNFKKNTNHHLSKQLRVENHHKTIDVYDIEKLLATKVNFKSTIFGEDGATVGQVLHALRVL